MPANDVKNSISSVISGGTPHGLSAFCYMKSSDGNIIKKFNLTDSFRDTLDEMISSVIIEKYTNDDIQYDIVDNISDDCNKIYVVPLTEDYNPFTFLDNIDEVIDAFTESDQENLLGFLFKFNINNSVVWGYQHVFSTSISKRKKGLLTAVNRQNIFEHMNKKLLCIDNRIDVIIVGSDLCPLKIKFLERCFGFETFIRNEAKQTIEVIETIDIVENINILSEFEGTEQTTNAKKLLKIKNSPVLRLSPNVIIERIQQIPRYSASLAINNGKIQLNNKKDVGLFLKLLGDDFLKSELTEEEYDSSNKKILEPIN